MDSRFRFLHHDISELWGHREGSRAGNGKTGASRGAVYQANPVHKAEL